MITAFSGTSSDRNTSMSSTKLRSRIVTNMYGSRCPSVSARSTPMAVWPPTCTSSPVPAVAAGTTSSRRRCTSSVVLTSCGALFGTTTSITPLSLARSTGTAATSRSCWTAARSFSAAARSAGVVASPASSNGPLKPGPKPSVSRSYARRVVNFVGSLPESATPRRSERNGIARISRTRRPPTSAAHGRRCNERAQRAHTVWSGSTRFFAPGSANLSIVWPTNPSTAGSSVTAAAITNSTASDAPTARPRMNDTPITKSPSSEITTVPPANSTARPLVSIAWTTARCGSTPSCSASR